MVLWQTTTASNSLLRTHNRSNSNVEEPLQDPIGPGTAGDSTPLLASSEADPRNTYLLRLWSLLISRENWQFRQRSGSTGIQSATYGIRPSRVTAAPVRHVENKCCKALFAGFLMVVAIVILTIGSVYYDECPAEAQIPHYLISSGVLILLWAMIFLSRLCCEKEVPRLLHIIFFLALSSLFIAGSVWTYETGITSNSTDVNATDYCNSTLVLFSVVLTATVYLAFLLGICCYFCCCLDMCLCLVD